MKINPDFSLCNDGEQFFVVSEKNNIKVPLVGEHLVALWNCVAEKDCTKEQLLHALLQKFDISTVLALNEIDVFLKLMKENGIIEL